MGETVRRRHVGTGNLGEAVTSESSPASSSGSPWIRVFFRVLFFAYYAGEHVGEYYMRLGFSRTNSSTNPFLKNPYAGRWKYLTSLNLVSRVWLRGKKGRNNERRLASLSPAVPPAGLLLHCSIE